MSPTSMRPPYRMLHAACCTLLLAAVAAAPAAAQTPVTDQYGGATGPAGTGGTLSTEADAGTARATGEDPADRSRHAGTGAGGQLPLTGGQPLLVALLGLLALCAGSAGHALSRRRRTEHRRRRDRVE